MTVQESFKRVVRARMAKTGESYCAARAQLLAGVDQGSTDEELPQLACSDERIRERTGRGWEEWLDLLDAWVPSRWATARSCDGSVSCRVWRAGTPKPSR